MTSSATNQLQRNFEFTNDDFNRLRHQVNAHTGIALAEGKQTLLYSRLSPRLRQLGFNRFRDYCDLIESGDPHELEIFVNAISTNLTSFFRESHHFDYLAETVLPELLRSNRASQRLRIWSTASSTGEEAYSIAMVLNEALRNASGWDVKILATDIDTRVLQTARAGLYQADRLTGLSPARLTRWFNRASGGQPGMVQVKPALRRMITFKQLNLMRDWPMRGPFDIVFCRNVVIYFDKKTQRKVFQRISDLMPASSHLFIGHSETLFKVSDRFTLIGKTIYRRN